MPLTSICQQAGPPGWCVARFTRPTIPFILFDWRLFLIAMSPAEVTEKLGLHRMRDRSWYVHPRSVIPLSFFFHILKRCLVQLRNDRRRSFRRSSMALPERQEAPTMIASTVLYTLRILFSPIGAYHAFSLVTHRVRPFISFVPYIYPYALTAASAA
jgi:hypothetical protein